MALKVKLLSISVVRHFPSDRYFAIGLDDQGRLWRTDFDLLDDTLHRNRGNASTWALLTPPPNLPDTPL